MFICFLAIVDVFAQDNKLATMEKRARELHRVIGLDDKEQWKKFMKENYTKSLQERPVKSNVETTDQESKSSATTTSTGGLLEEKLKVFERLHGMFGKSKIISLKPNNEKIDMTLENSSGDKGNFSITFENKTPYLIDGVRAEVSHH